MKTLGQQRLGRFGLVVLFANLVICTGCSVSRPGDDSAERVSAVTPKPSSRSLQPKVSVASIAAPAQLPAAQAPQVAVPRPVARTQHAAATPQQSLSLAVKRFVVASGVQDREPLSSTQALPADGSAIYAFAELANPGRASENVRITFERKGGAERVGDVTLPVPGNVSRHRTWAFTRFIRAAGVWDAVLWSESGAELGRTSFEVKAS